MNKEKLVFAGLKLDCEDVVEIIKRPSEPNYPGQRRRTISMDCYVYIKTKNQHFYNKCKELFDSKQEERFTYVGKDMTISAESVVDHVGCSETHFQIRLSSVGAVYYFNISADNTSEIVSQFEEIGKPKIVDNGLELAKNKRLERIAIEAMKCISIDKEECDLDIVAKVAVRQAKALIKVLDEEDV